MTDAGRQLTCISTQWLRQLSQVGRPKPARRQPAQKPPSSRIRSKVGNRWACERPLYESNALNELTFPERFHGVRRCRSLRLLGTRGFTLPSEVTRNLTGRMSARDRAGASRGANPSPQPVGVGIFARVDVNACARDVRGGRFSYSFVSWRLPFANSRSLAMKDTSIGTISLAGPRDG